MSESLMIDAKKKLNSINRKIKLLKEKRKGINETIEISVIDDNLRVLSAQRTVLCELIDLDD
jgi:hypothetical protein